VGLRFRFTQLLTIAEVSVTHASQQTNRPSAAVRWRRQPETFWSIAF